MSQEKEPVWLLFRSRKKAEPEPQSPAVRMRAEWAQQRDPLLRAFLQQLRSSYEYTLTHGPVTESASDDFWAAVLEAGNYHKHTPLGASRRADVPRALLATPPYQTALASALEEFASYWGVPGSAVRAHLDAEALNEHVRAGRNRGEWEEDSPTAYACRLVPRDQSLAPAVIGLLGAHRGQFTFDSYAPHQPGLTFARDDVECAEMRAPHDRYVLLFKEDGGMGQWELAEFFSLGVDDLAMLQGSGIERRSDEETTRKWAAYWESFREQPNDEDTSAAGEDRNGQ